MCFVLIVDPVFSAASFSCFRIFEFAGQDCIFIQIKLEPFSPKKLNEKKGAVGLWQCRECVLSALLLKAEPARAVIGKQKKFKASVKIGRSTPTS